MIKILKLNDWNLGPVCCWLLECSVLSLPGVYEWGEDLLVPLLRRLHQDPQRPERRQHRKQVPQTDDSWAIRIVRGLTLFHQSINQSVPFNNLSTGSTYPGPPRLSNRVGTWWRWAPSMPRWRSDMPVRWRVEGTGQFLRMKTLQNISVPAAE